MFYRPITKGGWHTYYISPCRKGSSICQNPLLRTYFLLKVKQEQFVLERYARLSLNPWSLAPPDKRGVGSWCQKSNYTKFLAISDHSEKNFFCQKYFLTRPQTSVTGGVGGWGEKEKFLQADGPIKGNTRRPHGPKKICWGSNDGKVGYTGISQIYFATNSCSITFLRKQNRPTTGACSWWCKSRLLKPRWRYVKTNIEGNPAK